MNNLLLQALRCQSVPRPPVWLMRQAGRYMPQYRALRAKHSLWAMFHEPDLATEVTHLPIEHLGVDAAILFSDILVIAEALGSTVRFPDQGGPKIDPPIHSKEQIALMPYIPVEESLHYVFKTIRQLRPNLAVPLIGFSGGPFTVASYFIDSSEHNTFKHTQRWLKEEPKSLHALLSKITVATIAYLKAQVEAGVDALQIFDSWANVLTEEEFAEFSLPYLKQIIDALKIHQVPLILFCRSSSLRAEKLAAINPCAISFDWHLPMQELRQKVPAHIAIQGNFNPEFLKLPHSQITAGVKELLASMRGKSGFIVNLGHGVTPDIPMENVRCFVDAVIQS